VKARRAARRLALDVLYEAEIRDLLPADAFAERAAHGWEVASESDEAEPASEDAIAYARELVAGVQEHQADIDELIARYADRWAIQRMPVLDRTLLRIALLELLWRDDIPVPVAINEAVELAKSLSTDDSGRFINGLLGRIVESRTAG
jgi:transcription antitermination protein NusB